MTRVRQLVIDGCNSLADISLLEYNDICEKMKAEMSLLDRDPLRSTLRLHKLQAVADKIWIRHLKDREEAINAEFE